MRKLVMMLIAVAGLVTASCGGAKPSRYYAIEVPSGTAGAATVMPITLLVGRITAPHILRDDRIAYRSTATEIGMYEYHRWAEPPATMLEALVVRRLRADGRYQSVQSLSSNAQGDYILRGRLHQFEEVSGGSGITARVSLEMELFEKKSGTIVWTNLFKTEEAVNGKEVPAVVDAMNTGTQRVLDQIATSLSTHFAKRPPK